MCLEPPPVLQYGGSLGAQGPDLFTDVNILKADSLLRQGSKDEAPWFLVDSCWVAIKECYNAFHNRHDALCWALECEHEVQNTHKETKSGGWFRACALYQISWSSASCF